MRDTKPSCRLAPRGAAVAIVSLAAISAEAAAPGITGPTFGLSATPGYISQPDGTSVYTWGYGCTSGTPPCSAPSTIAGAGCPTMQLPGPTLIVTEGQTVTRHADEQPAEGGGQHLDPVPRLCSDRDRGHAWRARRRRPATAAP